MLSLIVLLGVAVASDAETCTTGMRLFVENMTCTPCTGNTFCPYSRGCAPHCLDCPSGTIVDLKTNRSQCISGVCSPCPVGGYCVSGVVFTNCSSGTFNNKTGMDDSSACFTCYPGYWSSQGQTTCTACLPGTYSGSGSSACTPCQTGYYANSSASSRCTECTAGSISGIGQSDCLDCPMGHISGTASSICTPCQPGTYSDTGLVECLLCQPGFFSNTTAAYSNSSCVACPPGSYAFSQTACVACPVSTYQPSFAATSSAWCQNCTAHSATVASGSHSSSQCICDLGYYGSMGLGCTPCSPGSYADHLNMTACTLCSVNTVDMNNPLDSKVIRLYPGICTSLSSYPAVMTAPAGSTCKNISCNAGFYRASAICAAEVSVMSTVCLPCYQDWPNTYSLAGSTSCTQCTNAVTSKSSISTSTADCSCNSGFYKTEDILSACSPCPINQVCPGGYVLPVSCPVNSHSNQLGANSTASCLCNSGYFMGNSTVGSCSSCPRSSYCPAESKAATECPSNTTSHPNAISLGDCFCLPGFMSSNSTGGITGKPCVACNNSQFCSGGVASTCPPYSSIPTGSLGVTADSCVCWLGYYPATTLNCSICPSNHVCPYNISVPIPCPDGSQAQAAQFSFSACSCNAGFLNTNSNNKTAVNCTQCPASSYCSGGKLSTPTGLCPSNSASGKGSSFLEDCSCNMGFYGNALSSCSFCPPGFYTLSQTNSSACAACPPGSFSNLWPAVGQSNCVNCTAGHYAEQPSSTVCTPCPAGTWSAVNSSFLVFNCLPCLAGKFSMSQGLSSGSLCTSCAAGTFSGATGLSSQAQCQLCSAGTFSGGIGQTSNATCQLCPAGTFQQLLMMTTNTTCIACLQGFYSTGLGQSSNSSCTSCPVGTYQSMAGQASNVSCTACTAGYYSTGLSQVSNTSCLPCSSGSFSSDTGASGNQSCQKCSAGSYSSSLGASSNETCSLCTAGTYLTSSGATSRDSCSNCTAGTFNLVQGWSEKCTLCMAGTYSTETAAVSMYTCQKCSAGYYSTTLGANSSTTCTLCPTGTYSGMGKAGCDMCNSGFVLTTF